MTSVSTELAVTTKHALSDFFYIKRFHLTQNTSVKLLGHNLESSKQGKT